MKIEHTKTVITLQGHELRALRLMAYLWNNYAAGSRNQIVSDSGMLDLEVEEIASNLAEELLTP